LRFDFSHGAALTPQQLAEIERLVNEKIAANDAVKWEERPYAEVKGDPSILQFFGDKYGERVRVVSIGDFSKELCGGTHVRNAAKIGYFKIISEGAIAAGIRRIEAASGIALVEHVKAHLPKQEEIYTGLLARKAGLDSMRDFMGEETPEAFWKHWEARETFLRQAATEVAMHEKDEAKNREAAFQKEALAEAAELISESRAVGHVPFIVHVVDAESAAYLPFLADALKQKWKGVAVLVAIEDTKVSLLAAVAPEFTKQIQAGKIIQALAPLVGGKGGGRPELAQGGGNNPQGVPAALEKAEEMLGAHAG
jgi:alanyl-tRNA synthetase